MWPWEHAALGYLLYSLALRALGREPPSGSETIGLVFATQLPDLVDKPLSWGLGWFPNGFAVAHSAFLAVPAGLVALALGWRSDRRRLGVAIVFGYGSHLLGDVLNPLRGGESPGVARVLWPIAETAPYETDYGLGRGLVYFREFLATVPTMDLPTLALYVVLPAATVAVWLADDAPGVGCVVVLIDAVGRRVR